MPAQEVMAIIRDVENYPKWTSGLSNVSILERNTEGLPLKVSFKIEGGPISDEVELDYKWQDLRVDWVLAKGNVITELNGSYEVKPNDSGCEVTYELAAEISLPLPGFIKTAGEKTIVTAALQGLKDFAK
ncbi:MAG: hypothetical protein RLZZ330_743 [Actinomycetota bacterium]|jgi:ribosome-associated toxin RatA of RatAB toxin-antitoxin module